MCSCKQIAAFAALSEALIIKAEAELCISISCELNTTMAIELVRQFLN